MKPIYTVHYHEVALKGKNRPWFEKRLVRNIERTLRPFGSPRVQRLFGRIRIEGLGDADPATINERLACVFGISNFSPGWEIDRNLETLEEAVLETLHEKEFRTFACRSRRSDKAFPLNSPEINRRLGARVASVTGAGVDLGQPDLEIHVEVLHKKIHFYFEKKRGAGGLPVGVSGRLLCLLSGGIDSPVAAYRMLRRGAEIDYIHFHSYPFTSKASLDKVLDLVACLRRYQGSDRVRMIPFGDIQQRIAAATPERYRVVLYRRLMARIAGRIAEEVEASALVTGESLAQVASQTLENLAAFEAASPLPILRPLIGFDKQEIIATAQEIQTYQTSIQPHDDCCSFLLPTHPATRARLHDLENAERNLDIDALVEMALGQLELRSLESVASP